MALKDPRHKIQSSFAVFEFTNKELIKLLPENPYLMDWLIDFPQATVNSYSQWEQIVDGIQISALISHIEIVQQSLREYREKRPINDLKCLEHIDDIIEFLRHLRNSLKHTKYDDKKLIFRWRSPTKSLSEKDLLTFEKLKRTGLSIDIPVIKKSNGCYFNEKSRTKYRINFKIKIEKEITKEDFIHEIRLLSWHILAITKKQTPHTLFKYLHHTIVGT